MPRPQQYKKSTMKTYRITEDKAQKNTRAAHSVGATEGEFTRYALERTATEVLANPKLQDELKYMFAI